MLRIYVKRGALWRYHRLTRDSKKLPVSVEWDRRCEDRRAAAASPVPRDQRKADRRGAVPYTWDAAQFVVVEDARQAVSPS
jgi:hypothetical protein